MIRHLVLLVSLAALTTASIGQQLKLRLLETTDLHMFLVDFDYYQDKPTADYGLARTATLIKAARAEVKNSMLFDNGDVLQGGPMGEYVARIKPLQPGQVHPAFKVMNWLGYDAANVGNHEFNFGLPFLNQSLAGAAFPYVNANIYVDAGGGKAGQERLPAFRRSRARLHRRGRRAHAAEGRRDRIRAAPGDAVGPRTG